MRISSCRLLALVGGVVVVVALLSSGCANGDETLQSRIENKINNPETSSNVTPSSEHYNSFANDFEPEWPFGPLSEK